VRAIRIHEFGEPEVMRLEQVADPAPGPEEVLVRVEAAGVNPHDTYIRAGAVPGCRLPLTPGQDAAGVVLAVGSKVTRCAPGDRIYAGGSLTGTYATRALCHETQVHALPERLSFEQGAAIHVPYATAHRALFQRAAARAGETVLVHGASGAVGLAAVQLARAAGLRVLATGGSARGRALVERQGAHQVFDHHAPDSADRIRAATGGRGPEIILEMLASANLERDLELLAPRGRVVVIGSRGPIEIDPLLTMVGELSILGVGLLNATPDELREIHAALRPGLASGALTPVVRKALPLAEAARAHRLVLAPDAAGKIVLSCGPDHGREAR
jgi:NADPH2:quinone reductase